MLRVPLVASLVDRVPCQATFALFTMDRSRGPLLWRFRQAMWWRIMLARSAWEWWSVPSRVKKRSAVNFGSIRLR
jgi:hypothetical protein